MKVSVSLRSEDVAFLDAYAGEHELPSRSAAVQAAIRALRLGDLRDAYGDARPSGKQERKPLPGIPPSATVCDAARRASNG